MTIFYFTLKRSFANLANLIFLTAAPIACIFLPAGEGWPPLAYGYAYFGIVILFVAIRLAQIMMEDRVKGILKRLSVAPVRYFSYLGQHLLAYAVILILQSAVVVLGGWIAGQELHRPWALFALYVSFSFAALAMALAWISVFRSKDAAFLFYMSLIVLAALLGGIILPLEIFPDLLRRIAVILPTFWFAEGLKSIASAQPFADNVRINATLCLYALVFLVLGSTRRMQ
ncbi:ABC transporter permease [Saccharibacillus sacchari]|uniref:ABC transporter permease n=1 Tax=Saccharibacillus sacchari TaxID=456493 RepID=UPI0004B0A458|nr:ABC transporter permease [Saccharibacillus sacchari]